MATSENGKIRELPTQDSDEVPWINCEHCSILVNETVPVEGFCVECLEYMCKTCLMYHKMYMPTHSIQDQYNMPQEFCLENCEIHPNRLIKYYCPLCRSFACSECKAVDHKTCTETLFLPYSANGIEKSMEYRELTQTIQKLTTELDDIKDEVEHNLTNIEVQHNRAKSTLEEHREKIHRDFKKYTQTVLDNFDMKVEETFEKLKTERNILVQQLSEKERKLMNGINTAAKEVKKQIDLMKYNDTDPLLEVKSQIETISPDLSDQSECLVQVEETGNRCQLFRVMKQAEEIVENIQTRVKEVKRSDRLNLYVIIPEEINVQDICLESECRYYTLRMLPSCNEKRFVSFLKDIALKDLKLPTSCLTLHGNLLLTCECYPFIHFFKGVNQGKVVSEKLKMQSEPWAMAKAGGYKIAVTFPHEEIVRMIEFDDSMTVINTNVINVEGPCYGVAYRSSDKTLILSYNFVFKSQTARIQIVDLAGKVLKSIDQDLVGEYLFNDPHHLALSPDKTILYVSDLKNNAVTALSLNGKVKAIYKDENFKGPCQIVVDLSGTVYVCCCRSGNVYQLTSDLKIVKILLNFPEDIGGPTGLAFCQTNNLLYVGMENSELVKVYELSVVK